MTTPSSVAVEGVGFGALALATLGFLGAGLSAADTEICLHAALSNVTTYSARAVSMAEYEASVEDVTTYEATAPSVATYTAADDGPLTTYEATATQATVYTITVEDC